MKRTCEGPGCGKDFEAARSTARFCCPGCRVKAARAEKGAGRDVADAERLAVAALGLMKDRGAPGYTKTIIGQSGVVEQLQPTGARLVKEVMKHAADVNTSARAALQKRVPVAKPAPEVRGVGPAVLALMKSTLAKKDTRGPVPAKKKPAAQKGAES